MRRLILMMLCVPAAAQEYVRMPVATNGQTTCAMNAAAIMCAYEVRPLHRITVRELYAYHGTYSAGTMTVRLAIQADASGVPSGVDLAYVDVTPADNTWLGGMLSTDVALDPEQTYWTVARFISYSSGSTQIWAPFASRTTNSGVLYRRYDGSSWSNSHAGAGMLMVDAHNWPVAPVPVIRTYSYSWQHNYTLTCRAPQPMEIVGIVEWRWSSAGQATYTVQAQSGTATGYSGPGVASSQYAYVLLNQPIKVGAGQQYTIQRTATSTLPSVAIITGLPTRLQNYHSPCNGIVLVWTIEKPVRVVRGGF